jgi:formylglycine-generating enzyme required for sulfatase activity
MRTTTLLATALLLLPAVFAGAEDIIDSPAKARAAQNAWAKELGKPVQWTNSAGMTFRLIPPGTFTMGTGAGDADAPPRKVTISKPFYIGAHEVTRKQWEAVTGLKRSEFFTGEDKPINFITVYDARHFLSKLNKTEKRDARSSYRLPTEAEWEYAAGIGAGKLDDAGWYRGNAGDTTHPVGGKAANAFGLYDTLGNVWEWCGDYYAADYYKWGDAVDPTGPKKSLYGYRVLRGGSIYDGPEACRPGNRAYYQGSRSEKNIGFRIVLPIAAAEGKGVPQ